MFLMEFGVLDIVVVATDDCLMLFEDAVVEDLLMLLLNSLNEFVLIVR